jgi:thiol-disulfide isomerase/thioredoxin
MTTLSKRLVAGLVAGIAAVAAAWPALTGSAPLSAGAASLSAWADAGGTPSLDGATAWINSPPLSIAGLRGKVVLVDFWTYSCINCLRTLPYVRAWARKYRDQGLVVIGVHTPEFGFEHDQGNVLRATRDLGLAYPVALDSRSAVWQAFGNQAWPALYFIDAHGRIVGRRYGEGGYDESERTLQKLLRDAGARAVPADLVHPDGQGTQAAPAREAALSPETYVGAAEAANFVPAGGLVPGRTQDFPAAPALRLNEWSLTGPWRVEDEYALAARPGARLSYRFRARDLHLVLGGGTPQAPLRFVVRIDGKPPGPDHGSDVDDQGHGIIDGHRLYQLVRQQASGGERLFDIEFLDPGAQAYAFTFG